MKDVTIPRDQARRLALAAQRMGDADAIASGSQGVAQLIDALGYVQIDTISVVQRAHHHALWVRHPAYQPAMLDHLLASERTIYEYWGHAASYLPMRDFRFTLPIKERYRRPPTGKWEKERLARCGHLLEPVLARIRAEGPLRAQDFAAPPGRKSGTWWDWKPAKVALELLFWRGDLMISQRRNFQRVYDLTERVLPADVDTRMPDDAELGRFLVRRALQAHGFAPAREIRDHLRGASVALIQATLDAMVADGEVVPVQVECMDGPQQYALAASMERAANWPAPRDAVALLSPFDNAIIQRERTLQLFDFHYTLECYVPEPKRQYGYFVFSILYGDRLVGRFDPKADRKARVLYVRRLQLEAGFEPTDRFLGLLAQQFKAFAAFNRCDEVVLEDVRTPGVVRRTRAALKRSSSSA